MKTSIWIVTAILLLGWIGHAQAQRPQISLDVKKKLDTDTEQKASRYTSVKEQDRSIALTMQVRNNDPKEQTVKVSWYFIANPLHSGLENFVYDKGETSLTVPPRSATNLVESSRALGSKMATSRHSSKKEGSKPLGYIVTVAQDTNTLAVVASPASYDKVARNPAELQKLISTPAPPDL